MPDCDEFTKRTKAFSNVVACLEGGGVDDASRRPTAEHLLAKALDLLFRKAKGVLLLSRGLQLVRRLDETPLLKGDRACRGLVLDDLDALPCTTVVDIVSKRALARGVIDGITDAASLSVMQRHAAQIIAWREDRQ